MIPSESCRARTPATETLKVELLRELLRCFAQTRLHVSGSSMYPFVRSGDILLIRRENPVRIRTGEIALFIREGRLFAHRVVEKVWQRNQLFLITKGDALPDKDEPVATAQVLGRASAIIRGRQHIGLECWYRRRGGQVFSMVFGRSALWQLPVRVMGRLFAALP